MQDLKQIIIKSIVYCVCVMSFLAGIFICSEVKAAENTNQPTLRVGYLDEYDPYSNFKHKKHVMSGFVKFLVFRMEKDAGVTTKCRPYLNNQQMLNDLKAGKIDVVFPVYGDKDWAKRNGIVLTKPVDKSDLLLLHKGTYRPELLKKLGYLDKSIFEKEYLDTNSSYRANISFPDIVFAADAINEGVVSGVIVQATQYNVLEKYLHESLKLNKKVFAKDIEVCLALSEKSPYFLMVNKVISGISEEELKREIIRASNDSSQFTWKDFIIEHFVEFTCLIVAFIFLLISGFAIFYQASRKTAAVLLESKIKAEEVLAKETHLRQALEKAMFKAEHDSMTGLLNKGSFESALEAHKTNPNMACIVVDIDRFKDVNDNYGHDIGDQVIKAVAHAIKKSFRDSDDVARIGGDEFAVIMKDITSEQRDIIISRIKNVRDILERISNELPRVTLSVGIAFADEETKDNPKEVFLHADSVLYEVKDSGRDGFIFFN